ncbi:MAG: hypothetical protein IIC39_03845 [Candidatus Marinimicrobia bacterium]|nr:hypothetical protein [Candidatus Neomarinimicrobiota bacterium]
MYLINDIDQVAVGASPNSHGELTSLRGVQRRGKLEIEHTGRLFTHPVFSIPSYLESTPLDRGEYSWSGQGL